MPQHGLSPVSPAGAGGKDGPRSMSLSKDDECSEEADDDDDIHGWH